MGGGDCNEVADAESPAGGAAAAVTINVRCSNGTKFSVQTALGSTVGTFKESIVGNCEVPAPQQRLIYKGRILKDDQTLSSYGLEADHTIHLVRGSVPSASANPPTGASKTPTSTQSAQGGAGNPGSGESDGLGDAGFGGSLFPGLGALGGNGTSGLFGVGLPELEQMQQQLAQNPNVMREIMNMPAIQNLMSNPDLMRNFIMNNPQMRELIDRNPDLAHILHDPSTLRQTMEAARNPELMREMMRNTDRAMSNIESSPEGFNMLRRMYETVQEPFLNATTMAGDSGTGLGSNPLASLLGNQGAANARDRSTNPSTTDSETTGSPAPNTSPLPNPWNSAAGGGGQANNTRPSPADARTPVPGIAGLGGLGLPNLEQMLGGMQGSSPFDQLLQNPAVTQMMQTLLSNPQYMNQLLNLNPEARQLLEANPQFREMLSNPELLQQLTSPETLRQLQTFQQLFSSVGRQPTGQEQNPTGTAGTGTPNMGLDFLMNMFGGGLGATGLGVANPSNVPPEELYATQLSQLQEMGFFDTQENIRALSATAGNVNAAVERLLGNLGQ